MNKRLVFLALCAALLSGLLWAGFASGNPYDDYKTLTRAERRLALRYFWQLGKVKRPPPQHLERSHDG